MDGPLVMLRSFFSKNTREVGIAEFTAFFKALNDAERDAYKTAILAWDGKSEFISLLPVPVLALPPSTEGVVAVA